MLIFDPSANDAQVLSPLASDWLVLVVDSTGAAGTLRGCMSIAATVGGHVELGPAWTGQLLITPTFSGAVEVCQ